MENFRNGVESNVKTCKEMGISHHEVLGAYAFGVAIGMQIMGMEAKESFTQAWKMLEKCSDIIPKD